MALSPATSVAATFPVTTTADSGPGSLRQAILSANAAPGLDLIRFAIPSGPFTISPTTPLPSVTSPVDLDGKNFGTGPRIEIAGGLAGQGVNGLRVTAGSSLILSVVVRDFQAAAFGGGGGIGIVLENGGGNFLEDSVCQGNAGGGLLILNSSTNRIGSLTPNGTRNVFSQNGTGIRVEGTSNNNVIVGNRIGTDISGTVAQGNLGDGISISGGQGNDIAGASTHPSFENVISANGANGISISGSSFLTFVRGNKVGTDATGTADLGNAFNGIEIAGSPNNRIGPLFLGQQGNLISGNDAHGVRIGNGAVGNNVYGNSIGTDVSGNAGLGNAFNAVLLDGASSNTVGGQVSGEGNVLAGNGTRGVRLTNGASQNLVAGNRIGLSTGGLPLPNVVAGIGLDNAATNNTIGGTAAGAGNFISGNGGSGIFITDATVSGNAILGNAIGTSPAGGAAGNAVHGVHVTGNASGNTIGTPGGGNTIAFNSGDGVFVESGTGIPVRANRMVGNGGLGIDLAPDGVTPNDPGDSDSGPNALQNFPVLTLARSPGSTTVVQGSLASAPSTLYKVDFFWSSSCDPAGHGEGEQYLGTADVTTDGAGDASFTATLTTASPLGSVITATATDPGGNTSELSNCTLVGARFYTVTPCRIADTRDPVGPYGGPAFSNGTERNLILWNRCGIPATARAVSVNLTVTQPGGQGHMTLYPANAVAPSTSTINYSAGQTRANNAIVTLGSAGDLTARCVKTSGTVHAILDVNGYFE